MGRVRHVMDAGGSCGWMVGTQSLASAVADAAASRRSVVRAGAALPGCGALARRSEWMRIFGLLPWDLLILASPSRWPLTGNLGCVASGRRAGAFSPMIVRHVTVLTMRCGR